MQNRTGPALVIRFLAITIGLTYLIFLAMQAFDARYRVSGFQRFERLAAGCLAGSPYTLKQVAYYEQQPVRGGVQVVVHPSRQEEPPLAFLGPTWSREPLAPADDATRRVLRDYRCPSPN